MTNGKKANGKPVAEKKTLLNQPLPETMLGTKEMAAQLKIEPRKLRGILRAFPSGSGGEPYAWKEAELPKLEATVKKNDEEAARAEK